MGFLRGMNFMSQPLFTKILPLKGLLKTFVTIVSVLDNSWNVPSWKVEIGHNMKNFSLKNNLLYSSYVTSYSR